MDYEIRFATKEDISQIMKFIDDYWKKGHILANNRELFKWQYQGENKLNIVLGLKNNKLLGMLGYVTYDKSDFKDIALALWKAAPGESFLGIKLIMFLMDNEPHRFIICPGINMKTTERIYNRLGMNTGKMNQWYRLRPLKKYEIANISCNDIPKVIDNKEKIVEVESFSQFQRLFNFDADAYKNFIPFKSGAYIEQRYFNHPTYKYEKYGIVKNGKIETLVVFRLQEYKKSHVIRLVDIIGDISLFPAFSPFFDEYMEKVEAEYIDIYEAGMLEELMITGGWLKVENSGNIIPNYFSPYTAENVNIFYSTSDENAVLFKGDGDQDRPN